MLDLRLEDFLELCETVRVAEHLEDRRSARVLAPLHYAVLYRDAGKEAPSFARFLAELNLDQDWDDDILGPLPGASEARTARPPTPVEPTDDNEWGEATIADLMEYKQRTEGRRG